MDANDWLAVLTAVYVVATIAICIFNYKSAKATRDQINESKRQFEMLNRPWIVIDINFVKGTLCFIIRNEGPVTAERLLIKVNNSYLSNITNQTTQKTLNDLSAQTRVVLPHQEQLYLLGTLDHQEEAPVFQIEYGANGKVYQENFVMDNFNCNNRIRSISLSTDLERILPQCFEKIAKAIGEIKIG